MYAENVERPLPNLQILFGIIGSTLEKNPMSAKNVKRPFVTTLPYTWVGRINAEEPQDMSVVCEMGEATVTSISLCQPQDLCTTLLGR